MVGMKGFNEQVLDASTVQQRNNMKATVAIHRTSALHSGPIPHSCTMGQLNQLLAFSTNSDHSDHRDPTPDPRPQTPDPRSRPPSRPALLTSISFDIEL